MKMKELFLKMRMRNIIGSLLTILFLVQLPALLWIAFARINGPVIDENFRIGGIFKPGGFLWINFNPGATLITTK